MKREPKKLIKRILAIALALVLIFGVLPNTQLTGVLSAEAAEQTDLTEGYEFTAQADYTGDVIDLSSVTIKVKKDSDEYELEKEEDYVIDQSTDTFTDAGTYSFSISSKENGRYKISDNQEVSLTIMPAELNSCSDLSIELSSESAYYTKSEITLPDVTVKYKNTDITDQVIVTFQYDNENVDIARETGKYSVTVSPKETTANFSGSRTFDYVFTVVKDEDDSAFDFSINDDVYENLYKGDEKSWISGTTGNIVVSVLNANSGIDTVYYKEETESDYKVYKGESLIAGKAYSFKAVNKSGIESSVHTFELPSLDTTDPIIVIKDGENEISDKDTLYLKDGLTNGEKIFSIEYSDLESGINEKTNNDTFQLSSVSDQTGYQKIINSVSDNVKNETEHSFEVFYDANAPVISEAYINTEDTTSIITNGNVTVYAVVEDDTINDEKMLASVILKNMDPESDESYKMELVSEEAHLYSCTVDDDKFLKGIYQVYAEDKAGNSENSDDLEIEITKEAPAIERITATTSDGKEITDPSQWVNQDTTFEIAVKKVDDDSDAEVSVEYSTDNEKWTELSDYVTEDNGKLVFYYTEEDDTFEGTYYFRTKDNVGNIGEENTEGYQTKDLKKDKVKPSTDNILISYTSDLTDDSSNAKTTGIRALFSTIKSFFGRKQVTVDLYVSDSISGVAEITYEYNDKKESVKAEEGVSCYLTEKEDGIYEPEEKTGEAAVGYQHFDFSVSGADVSDVSDRIRILTITDEAKNVYDVSADGEITTSDLGKTETMLIIDDVNPVVVMQSEDTDVRSATTPPDQVNYFSGVSGYESITLTYTERFFAENTDEDGDPIKPIIQLTSKDTTEGTGEAVSKTLSVSSDAEAGEPYVEWGEYSSEKQEITATVYLPYSADGGEIEYVIETSYTDGSENELADSQEDGTVSSNVLVLDNKAPELVFYEIITESAYTINDDEDENGTNVYSNTGEDTADIEIEFTINDNDSYWDEDSVDFKLYRKDADKETLIDAENYKLEWNPAEGRNHTAKVTFNGEENVAAEYYATVSYADKAGNMLISAVGEDKNNLFDISDGTYTSAEFILDHAAPIFNISYNNAYRLVKDSETASATDKKNSVPETGYTAYYGEAEKYIFVTVEITEDYAVVEKFGDKITALTDFVLKINDSTDNLPAIEWTYDENTKTYTGEFYLTEDGYYNIEASCQDAAGNNMAAGDEVQGSETNTKVDGGTYKSTELVIDKKAPKIQVSYDGTIVNTVNSRDYFDDVVNAEIVVADDNIRNQELKDSMSAANAYLIQDSKTNIWDSTEAGKQLATVEGEKITRNETGEESFSKTYSFALSTEANYDLLIQGYEDLAGNKAVVEAYNPYICVDYSAPSDLQIDYSVSGATFLDKVNYKLHGYAFADNKLTVTVSAKDKIGGIHTFKFKVTDEDGNVTEILRTMNPVYSASESIELPLKNADFKGSVEVTVTDWSDNSSVKQQGQIVESSSKHNSTGSAVITTYTKPSRTVNGVDYYNTNVAFNLKLKDTYSGISSYQYTAGSQISEKASFRDKAGTNLSATAAQSIINEVNRDLTLVASANNQNDVKVQASYVDNAGHTGSVEQTYNIDITAPTIQVTYDNNNPANEKYYKDNRTATVVITERNFDPNDVVFSITNTDGVMPSISGWTTTGTGDNTKHTARVSFTADGDYTFTVECQDLAGNKSHYGVVDEFTIDKTIPTYMVSYDNNSFQNQYYYDANRVATIDILEHNFDSSAVNITVTKDGVNVTPVVSGWSKNGDHNIATVSFSADGEYTFTFSGVDMADNAMTDYTLDHFVVDTENPEIEIFNIENMSANKDVVQPGIRYNDTNYDANATEVEMTGYHNGVVEMNGQRTVSNTGVEVLLNDFEHIQEMDDLYTMHATVYDLAGNSSEAEVIFSVNRFGSVYTFDNATDELVGEDGKYYTNKEQDIVVYETNVDTLEFQEITCNLNGELSTLKEGEDFTVSESGSQETWKQYTYKIAASNFENEGTYALTIYSEDRAENTSDNNSKGKKVEFVVDKTDPTIKISGVDEGATYKEEAHEVTIAVDDNVLLSSVKVDVDGETIQEFNASDIEAENGILSFDVQSKNSTAAQAMVVSAVDAAGNSFHTDGVNFWVTTNILILYFAHKGIFFGTIAGAAAVIAVVIGRFYIIPAKKKSDDEEDQ